jgi:hypothetical protein
MVGHKKYGTAYAMSSDAVRRNELAIRMSDKMILTPPQPQREKQGKWERIYGQMWRACVWNDAQDVR